MRYLLIILLFIGCADDPTVKDIDDIVKLKEECERLINDTYDPVIYPDNECRCIYVKDGDNYVFSHHWTPKQYQMWLDSAACEYSPVRYNSINIIKNDVIIGGVTLTCDC